MKQLITIWCICYLFITSCALNTVLIEDVTPRHPVINEIMSNPVGSLLPQYEWIELYNPSDETIDLSRYQFTYNNRSFALPNQLLSSQQYVILTDARYEAEFSKYGNVIGLAVWPQLSNTGATLTLNHIDAGVVDQVSYTNQWYNTVRKRNGWTLERINPSFSCNPNSNWAESESLEGGTPGRRNSVFDSTKFPQLSILSSAISDNVIQLVFNTNLEEQITLNKIESDLKIQSWRIKRDTLEIQLSTAYTPGQLHQITSQGHYCKYPFNIVHEIFVNPEILAGDILINEILFNPKESGVDFVEIYNNSNKIIDLRQWRLGTRILANTHFLFHPDTYAIITTSPDITKKHYPSTILTNTIQLPSLPAYANQQGIVTLFYQDQLIDSLRYYASMYSAFLTNVKGISLERITADRPTNDNNFTSSSTYGEGATPGYINSKTRTKYLEKNKIFTESDVFQINSNSSKNEYRFYYEFTHENLMVSMTIYDNKGRAINRLIRQKNVGYRGYFSWNGKSENNTFAATGTYLFGAEIYNEKGASEVLKGSFTVIRKSGEVD